MPTQLVEAMVIGQTKSAFHPTVVILNQGTAMIPPNPYRIPEAVAAAAVTSFAVVVVEAAPEEEESNQFQFQSPHQPHRQLFHRMITTIWPFWTTKTIDLARKMKRC
jgi:hypothetical protein